MPTADIFSNLHKKFWEQATIVVMTIMTTSSALALASKPINCKRSRIKRNVEWGAGNKEEVY